MKNKEISMTDRLSIALAQINPILGDINVNLALIEAACTNAKRQGADLVVFPELCVAGYPPEDLVLKPAFQEACRQGVLRLAQNLSGGPAALIGAPWMEEGKLFNAALLLDEGRVAATRLKQDLPNYGVFDEKRVFSAGPPQGPVNFRGVRLGVMICEDMWGPDVTETLAESGAEILLLGNGSPYELDKQDDRITLATARVVESGLPLIYVNQVGGQDELVFDGGSFVLDADRMLKAQLPQFLPGLAVTQWQRTEAGWRCAMHEVSKPLPELDAVYSAMVLGLRDYVGKNGFPGVILGLSGGIDSALSAAVAVDAIGADKIHAVMMPSPFTSPDSLEDAEACAKALGIDYRVISIEPAMKAFGAMLAPSFAGRAADTTEENIQARARGITLMGLSNKFGYMVLSTGNKSEMSVGYATLYGDMCGGYSVLKDVYKTMVYRLSDWRNQHRPVDSKGPAAAVIPNRILTKAPTAELKPNQTDQDSLPPYDVLDGILMNLIEGELSVDEVTAHGFDREMVLKVWRMLDLAEYKRRQAPPGVKITRRAFGRDRRYPIVNGFRPWLRSDGKKVM